MMGDEEHGLTSDDEDIAMQMVYEQRFSFLRVLSIIG